MSEVPLQALGEIPQFWHDTYKPVSEGGLARGGVTLNQHRSSNGSISKSKWMRGTYIKKIDFDM